MVSLIGDIAVADGDEPRLHAHIVLGCRDGSSRAGCGDDGRGSSENLGDTAPTTERYRRRRSAVSGCKVESGSTSPSDEQVVSSS